MGGALVAVGGPVGLDQSLPPAAIPTSVERSRWPRGSSGDIRFAGYLKVGGDLFDNAGLSAIGYINILRDAWINGNASALGLVSVGRDLHLSPGSSPPAIATITGQTVTAPFNVTTPCDCAPGDLVDIGGIVANAQTNNDNATIPLDPGALSSVVGLGVDITLPCGRFYLDSIGGLGTITVHVPGRTALFVGGDVNALGALNVQLGPSGELGSVHRRGLAEHRGGVVWQSSATRGDTDLRGRERRRDTGRCIGLRRERVCTAVANHRDWRHRGLRLALRARHRHAWLSRGALRSRHSRRGERLSSDVVAGAVHPVQRNLRRSASVRQRIVRGVPDR